MPKIIGGSLREHREQTRQKLFDALSTLMAGRAFESITLADIAMTAGVGRTAVYNHFADKETLLVEFVAHETSEYAAALQRALDRVPDPVEQLRAYVQAQARLKHEYHISPTDLRAAVSRGTAMRLREHVTDFEAVLRGILRRGIDAGDFPDQDLSITIPLLNACLSSRSVSGDAAMRARVLAHTEQFALRAVGALAPLLV